MSNKSSNLSATPSVRLLKDQITGMESTLRHLHNVLGSHINALDKTLIKGQNVKPVVQHAHLLKAAASPLSLGNLFSSLARGAGGMLGGGGSSGGADRSADSDFAGLSQGQIWGDAARALSTAMKRYL